MAFDFLAKLQREEKQILEKATDDLEKFEKELDQVKTIAL